MDIAKSYQWHNIKQHEKVLKLRNCISSIPIYQEKIKKEIENIEADMWGHFVPDGLTPYNYEVAEETQKDEIFNLTAFLMELETENQKIIDEIYGEIGYLLDKIENRLDNPTGVDPEEYENIIPNKISRPQLRVYFLG